MNTIILTKFAPTALAAAAIGFGALMTVGAPSAHASAKSDCESKGGTYSETTIVDNRTGNASRVPVTVGPGVIVAAENVEPAAPIHRVPLGVVTTDGQFEQAP